MTQCPEAEIRAWEFAIVGMAGPVPGRDRSGVSLCGVTPGAASGLDPRLRLFAEQSWHALADAGHDPGWFNGAIGLFTSEMETGPGTAAEQGGFATRVSGMLGLRGPCRSEHSNRPGPLAAVCVATASLANGECEVALAGANSGSGATIVVMRRLADALADGDHLRAVLRCSGGTPDPDLLCRLTAAGLVEAIRSMSCEPAPPPVDLLAPDRPSPGRGTRARLVLAPAPAPAPRPACVRTHHLLVWSAQTETALAGLTGSLRDHLAASTDGLGDVAHTLQIGQAVFEHRSCLVSSSPRQAAAALADPGLGGVLTAAQRSDGHPVGLLIAGVGEQYAGLVGRLFATEPTFRDRVEAGRAALRSLTGHDPLAEFVGERRRPDGGGVLDFRALAGRGPAATDAAAAALARTEVLQPALFTLWHALAQTLREWGLHPAVMLGYSLGEYVAACLSGVLSFEDALGLVAHRAELISRMPRGAMAAIALGEAATRTAIAENDLPLDVAGVNAPLITVVAGPPEAVGRLRQALSARDVASRLLDTSHAFHSRWLAGAAGELTAWIRGHVTLRAPQVPYLSNVTGRGITAEEATDPGYWARHMCATVRFSDGVTNLLALGDLTLLEIGPGPSLGTMIRANPRCDRGRWGSIIAALPSHADPRPADLVLTEAIGRLWLAGAPIDFAAYNRGQGSRRVSLPRYPPSPERRLAVPLGAGASSPGAEGQQPGGSPAHDRQPGPPGFPPPRRRVVFQRVQVRDSQGREA